MSRMHGVFLAAIASVAALAVTAVPALGAIEIKTEPNPGEHCPAISATAHIASGGCGSHKASIEPVIILAHNNIHTEEYVLAICNTEFEGRIDENGEGLIYNQVFADTTPGSCVFEPCEEGGTGAKEIWPGQIVSVGGKLRVEVTFCIQLKGSGLEGAGCVLHIPLTSVGHTYTVNAEPEVGCESAIEGEQDEREVRGRWTTEQAGEGPHTSIEIVQT